MNTQDLRKILEESKNKFNIFADRSVLAQYSLTVADLLQLVKDFLSDEEKGQLFELEHFKKLPSHVRCRILQEISNSEIKLAILENASAVSDLENYHILALIQSLDSNSKLKILHNSKFLEEHEIKNYDINKIVTGLDDDAKLTIITDISFTKDELHLKDYQIADAISSLQSEEAKLQLIDRYDFKKYQIMDILKNFSDKSKESIILNNKYGLERNHLVEIIAILSSDSLVQFIRNNKKFMEQNGITPYRISKRLSKDEQLQFTSRIEEMGLSLKEKRQIFATLSQEAKNEIDVAKLPEEYRTAIEMQVENDSKNYATFGKINLDFSKDMELYKGLDELIYLNPMELPIEHKDKILELCRICPEIKIGDDLGLGYSTSQEYINAEMWIASVFKEMDENWSSIQKIAYIDNAIGKKISYSPDFDTEVFNPNDSRALWKIIDSGYGVCNGIAQVEKYMLGQIGVEAEMASGINHSFLKLKNVELPNPDGTKSIGDTILDPTWNLMMQRYGAKPGNFCKSYAEIRKNDIDANRIDRACHKNDEELASATLNLDDKCLRSIYTSIGLADKEGKFPIQVLFNKCKSIDDLGLPAKEELKRQLEELKEYYPDFAKCQNSTIGILQCVALNQKNLQFNRCVVNRVYARDDSSKRPVLYVYADLPEAGKQFYFVDTQRGEFIETTQKEFEAKFECYEMDLEKTEGHRPWEDKAEINKQDELEHSSGRVVAQEGEER